MVPKLRFKEFCGKWEEKRLGEIGFFKNGISKGNEYFGRGYKFVNLQDVFNTNYLRNKNYGLVELTEKELLENNLKKGDVIFVRSSVNPSGVGLTSVVLEELADTVFAGFLIRFREYEKVLDLNYKRYCFYFPGFRNELLKRSTISANTNINQDNLAKLKINIPSLPEQAKIADFLSTVDDKIQNQQDKITHLENIKKGFMQKIFSRKIRFKDDGGEEFPEWEEKKLGDVCTFKQGLQVPIEKQNYEFLDGMIRFIRIVDYTQQTTDLRYIYDNPKLKKVKKDDIVIVRYGANAGFIGKGIEGVIANNMFTITPINNIKKEYLYFYLRQDKIFENMNRGNSSSAMPALSFNQLSVVKIRYPCLKEQQKIADFLTSFDEKIFAEKEILEHLKQLKKGLLQQMFV